MILSGPKPILGSGRLSLSWGLTAVFAGILVLGAGAVLRHPESGPALRGMKKARAMGCFSCHGPEGAGGVGDPGLQGRVIPGWGMGDMAQYVREASDLEHWVLQGKAPGPPSRAFLSMPAYAGRLSRKDLEDILACLEAVSGSPWTIPPEAAAGFRISLESGCFGCHGPGGLGGLANPGSFKGVVASWDGKDFARLVRDKAEFREWVLEGRSARIARNPLARFFLNRALLRMPAYKGKLSDTDLGRIEAYVQWRRGP